MLGEADHAHPELGTAQSAARIHIDLNDPIGRSEQNMVQDLTNVRLRVVDRNALHTVPGSARFIVRTKCHVGALLLPVRSKAKYLLRSLGLAPDREQQ